MEELHNQLLVGLQSGAFSALLLAYLGGVLTSATPCIYPMIPITVGVVGGHAGNSRLTGFLLSVVYAVGLAVVYGGLGVFAAASGQLFGEVSTSPIGYFLVANLCLFFGAWMMDWVQLPQMGFHLSPSAHGTDKAGLSRWFYTFFMGCASGLVAAPCTAPVLATLLTYVATTGNVVYGGILLFVFAFGLSTLLIVIGTFTGLASALPRSGLWMIWLKKGLALVMLGTGEYFLVQMGTLLF